MGSRDQSRRREDRLIAESLLAGVRVVDLTTVVFGPLATQVLADYGADVIKIEPPEGDVMRFMGAAKHRGMSAIFLNLNRGKRSVPIDLKTADGRAIVLRLLEDTDVFVHNIRRDALARLGLAHADLAPRFPRLLFCAATGFPESSRFAGDAAIDDVIQAAGGIAALNGEAKPRLVPTLLADKSAGLGLACAILAGLYARTHTGRGSQIEVPMYDTFASFTLLEHLQGETYAPAIGPAGYRRVTADGRRIYAAQNGFLTMTPYSTDQWIAYLRATDRAHLTNDRRITDPAERSAHIAELYDLIEAATPSRTIEAWLTLAQSLGFPAKKVATLHEVARDPELARSGALLETSHPTEGPVRMLAAPGQFDGQPARHPGHAPAFGEHTREVLRAAGYDNRSIDELHHRRVVVAGDSK